MFSWEKKFANKLYNKLKLAGNLSFSYGYFFAEK